MGCRNLCIRSNLICWKMSKAPLKPDYKTCALIKGAADLNFSSMKPDEFSHQGESNTRTFVCSGACAAHPMKPLEEMRQLGLSNSDSRILNLQFDLIAQLLERKLDATLKGKLEGIREQIENNFLPHLP